MLLQRSILFILSRTGSSSATGTSSASRVGKGPVKEEPHGSRVVVGRHVADSSLLQYAIGYGAKLAPSKMTASPPNLQKSASLKPTSRKTESQLKVRFSPQWHHFHAPGESLRRSAQK
ncbi:hypothetical protein CMUS01_06864 [Colletotrichum musicola]|uniref:Uncharacterized protein n=1 Tax=Colletotrichum musicola TaxID=2175873 RepID=A0A8H6KK81_9PEZI|nr:hypothetical protein CMUS01_06864 [Colletotrichum musicola]